MKILQIIDPAAVVRERRFHAHCTVCDWESPWCVYQESVETVARDHVYQQSHRVVIEERE